MTPHQIAKARRLKELGFKVCEIQTLCKLTNAEVRSAVGLPPLGRRITRNCPDEIGKAIRELVREGHSEQLIAANFGPMKTQC